LRLTPGDLGQPMSLLSLQMDAFSSLPDLLGEISGSGQNAVEQGATHRDDLYLSL
jgi:hypothetical protein